MLSAPHNIDFTEHALNQTYCNTVLNTPFFRIAYRDFFPFFVNNAI